MTSTDRSTVGLIGVGLLGTALAERLVAAGFRVVGFDVVDHQREQLAALGGEPVASAIVVAEQAKRIVLSLPDSTIVSALLETLGEHIQGVDVIIDTTTGAPGDAVAHASRLALHRVAYLDATIAGSSVQTRQGTALMMLGGAAETCELAGDILDAISTRRFHVGPAGAGARMKLVVNLAIGLHRAVLAEALTFGESLGFAGSTVLDVLRASPGHSRMMDTKGRKMVDREFAPQARLRQHLKDVELMIDAAGQQGAYLPLTTIHVELLRSLVAAGFGDEDNSAILRAFLPQPQGGRRP